MEDSRLRLSSILKQIAIESGEEAHTYFQPPETIRLIYPCFIYHLKSLPSNYADDAPYLTKILFDVIYISRSPSSSVPALLQRSAGFSFDRYYSADNLHHYAYTYATILRRK